jgi:3-phytase
MSKPRFQLERVWGFLGTCAAVAVATGSAQAQPSVAAELETAAVHQYESAPLSPRAHDPAIWVHPTDGNQSLVIGTLQAAGLQVFDLSGNVLQTVRPPRHAAVSGADPAVPGEGAPLAATGACAESASGNTFGRFDNVVVAYGVPLRGPFGVTRKLDLAVVSDRGCDRLRIYDIRPTDPNGPLVDITALEAPRVYPDRFSQPSLLQPSGLAWGLTANPLDAQTTAHGLAISPRAGALPEVFVTQRHTARALQLALLDTGEGRVSYARVRDYHFPVSFAIPHPSGLGSIFWNACRTAPKHDPELEGLVVDTQHGVLYASQEQTGIYKIPLGDALPAVLGVPASLLIERVKSFGAKFWAVPEGDRFSCSKTRPASTPLGTVVGPGNASVGGAHLTAHVEGLAIAASDTAAGGYLLVSSAGNSTLHAYAREGGFSLATANPHLATFQVEGTADSIGLEVVTAPQGAAFPGGLFVVQNGAAMPPESDAPINGFQYLRSSNFQLVDWSAIEALLP